MKRVIENVTFIGEFGEVLPTDEFDKTSVAAEYKDSVVYENVLYSYIPDDYVFDPEDDDALCAWYERNDPYEETYIDPDVIHNLKNSIKVIADKLFKCMK